VTGGNPARGETLFKMTTLPGGKPGCASCHTLAAAGTTGTLGPNLDAAFAADKSKTFASAGTINTIRDVVRGQIAYSESDTGTPAAGMPSNLLTGKDATDVADFVAQCAAVPHCRVGTTPSSSG
jgi:mono/diheme cytochrome c family protein